MPRAPALSLYPFILHIVPFNTDANETHARYGTSRIPATGTSLQKRIIVVKIATHKTRISMNAPPTSCRPKNKYVQPAFKIN